MLSKAVPTLQLQVRVDVKKFSIIVDDAAEITSLFNIEGSKRSVVQCHSDICKMRKGSRRKVDSLLEESELCRHLSIFREFYLNNIESFGEVNDDVETFLLERKVFIKH